MTTTVVVPVRPPLVRPARGRTISGVAAGTAAHLRMDPMMVRVLLVVLASFGVGAVFYGLLWLTMPVAAPGTPEGDAEPEVGRPSRWQTIGLAVLGVIGLAVVSGLTSGGQAGVLVPLVVVAAGLTVIWRQLDVGRPLVDRTVRWALVGGVVLGIGGVVLLLSSTGQLANARNGFGATVVIIAGIVLASAPLWRRLLDQRTAERSARIRSEERAAVATHLHDSVLQTLALIQRNAEDPHQVSRLARSQERELRAWLYEPAVVAGGTWAGVVAALVAEVEADHAVTVEHVVVGDVPVDDSVAALGQATREAVVNAAKHSGARSVALYSEATDDTVTVFVRDRGLGFDPDAVPADRRGLRDSVVGRLVRHGGTAVVRSTPGEGTEVELCLPRSGT